MSRSDGLGARGEWLSKGCKSACILRGKSKAGVSYETGGVLVSCIWMGDTGVGLQPRGPVCPGASNWGDCDPGAAAGQTKCSSTAAAGTHPVHTNVFIFSLVDPHPAQLGGEGRMRLLVLSVFT